MRTFDRVAAGALLVSVAAFGWISSAAAQSARVPEGPKLGVPVTAADIANWDISVGPDGAGLPPGKGTAATGAAVYQAKCLACHGEKGAGKPSDQLVGGQGTLRDANAVRTVGSYWPYSTTLFDYIRRAMPYVAPQSLTGDEIYSLAAYILYLNGVIAENDEMNATTLPQVKMPNRDNFVPVYTESKHPMR
jgi:S-disulfanyl-L-cysteine oxidoreductase SoxD